MRRLFCGLTSEPQDISCVAWGAAYRVVRRATVKSDERSSAVRVYEENLASIYELVFQFFNDDMKTRVWLRTPNPMLGDTSPRDIVRMGRYDRLLRFVTQAIEEGQLSRPVLERTGGA